MRRIKKDLAQGRQQQRKLQNSSPADTIDNASFGKLRPPLATRVQLRPVNRIMIWSLGLVGVIAIATLAWLAGSGGSRVAVSMSALEAIESTDTNLAAELQASLSASDDLREKLVLMTDLVANLEARLAKMDTLLDSVTTSATLAVDDPDETIGLRRENKAIKDFKRGDGNPVAAVQSHLMFLGYDPGPIDGNWGAKTCKALKAYQKDKGLPVSCAADNRTVAAVQSRLIDLGYDPGSIDGTWGTKTCKALKAYQRDNGLPISCRADDRTVATFGIQ